MKTRTKTWADVLHSFGYEITGGLIKLRGDEPCYLYIKRIGEVLFVIPRPFGGPHPYGIVAFNYINGKVQPFSCEKIECYGKSGRAKWKALKRAEANLSLSEYLWSPDLTHPNNGFAVIPSKVVNFFKRNNKTIIRRREELTDLICKDEYNTPWFAEKRKRFVDIVGLSHMMVADIDINIKRRQYAVSQEG